MDYRNIDLLQNDTFLEVGFEFEKMYNLDKDVIKITNRMMEDYKDTIEDPNEEYIFWLSLSNKQWDFGVLLPMVKEKALNKIDECTNSNNNQSGSTKMHPVFVRFLCELRAKLLSPQPSKKKPAKRRVYKCSWKIGDVYAYRMESELAKEKGLYGRYLLIHKIDEGIWYPGHVIPIVYTKITKGTNIPISIEEYNKLEYVQVGFSRYEERFWPIDMTRPQEDIAEKSQINYQVDEYGFLPQYRMMIVATSRRMVPTNLIYVGNYQSTILPQKEFIPHSKSNILSVFWKQFDETLETRIIKLFCGHNLRMLAIYKNNSL